MATDLDQLRQRYQDSVAIHGSNWKLRGPAFVELVRPLMNPEAITAVAVMERDYLRSTLSLNSIGTKLSNAGYIKGFKAIPLVDGQNATQYTKHDGSVAIRHVAHDILTLSPDEWNDRNDTTRVIDRIEDSEKIALNPQDYLQAALSLLDSRDWVDVAAGLIALTGRRPHEIVARGSFSRITGSDDWAVKFTGQGKKRGENPVFAIPTLCPPSVAIAALKVIRKDEDVARILAECCAVSDDKSAQNVAIDSYTNKRINRAIKRHFGSILPRRKGDKVDEETEATGNCKALRAAYAAIAAKRDKSDRSISEQLLYAGRALGHVATDKVSDKDLAHLLTTLGYSDFVIDGVVPFLDNSAVKKSGDKLSVTQSVHEWVNEKKEEWGCTQSQVIERLIAIFESSQSTELAQISEDEDMGTVAVLRDEVAALANQVTALTQAVQSLQSQPIQPAQPIQPVAVVSTPKPVAPKPVSTENNMALATAADLWGENWDDLSRLAGAAEERVDRAIKAIFAYNDQRLGQPAKGKWAVGNRTLRDLTGANGQLIAARLKLWQGVIDEHHAKHEIEGDYHNRTHHRGEDVCYAIRPMILAIDP